jgi:Sec-independent protein translocase protein TatA
LRERFWYRSAGNGTNYGHCLISIWAKEVAGIRGFQDASKEFEAEFKREAEEIEQAVKTPALPESKEVATHEAATAESNNHAATSSQQT